jgi:AcrR family transcriptional regulator
MPKPRASTQAMRTEATRTKLVNSAYNVFIRDGFSAASIDAICRGAGYSRGAFYANFEDKEDLFLAVYARQVDSFKRGLQADLEGVSGPVERAEVMRNFYLGQARDQRWLLLLLEFRLYAIRKTKVRRRLEKFDEQSAAEFESLVKTALEDPSREHRLPPETLAAATLGILYGLTVESLFEPAHLSKENVQDILRAFINVFHPVKPAVHGPEVPSIVPREIPRPAAESAEPTAATLER